MRGRGEGDIPFFQHLAGDEFCEVVFAVANGLPPETVLLVHDGQDVSLLEWQSSILGREGRREGGRVTLGIHTCAQNTLRSNFAEIDHTLAMIWGSLPLWNTTEIEAEL